MRSKCVGAIKALFGIVNETAAWKQMNEITQVRPVVLFPVKSDGIVGVFLPARSS